MTEPPFYSWLCPTFHAGHRGRSGRKAVKVINPNIEIRNPKQIRISNVPNSKHKLQWHHILATFSFVFWYFFFFLLSHGKDWNNFEYRMLIIQEIRKSKHPFWSFVFWILVLFRVSDFGFRISHILPQSPTPHPLCPEDPLMGKD